MPVPPNVKDAMSVPTDLPAVPHYTMAHYDKLRKELRELIGRRKTVDKNLENLEDHIFKFETSYLEDTQNGNIVRGFDNYIKGTVARRRAAVGETDRVFSSSSYTYLKSKEDASTNNTDVDEKKKKRKRKGGEDESGSESEVTTKKVRISFSALAGGDRS